MLAKKVDAVAGSFSNTIGLPANVKFEVTGNPVRAVVLAQSAAPYLKIKGQIDLLVFGGSQGARAFSDLMPLVFAQMPVALRNRIFLTQQCRAEDIERVRAEYMDLGMACDLKAFFIDMPKRIANSHLVIARSGASTIAELGVIGRPAILVPLPHALDNDQLRNAESFAAAGAGWLCPQATIDPQVFATFLMRLLRDGAGLKRAAESALNHGKPDAAERLADLVEKTINTERL